MKNSIRVVDKMMDVRICRVISVSEVIVPENRLISEEDCRRSSKNYHQLTCPFCDEKVFFFNGTVAQFLKSGTDRAEQMNAD